MSRTLVTYRGTVYPWHCDHVGHMNVMWYVAKFDEATWQLLHELGLAPSFLRKANRGMAAVDQHLSYLQELHAGDVVTVKSGVLEVKDKSIRFVHEMWNDETASLAARTTIKAVHLDTELRKACAFPQVVAKRAAALIVPEAHKPISGSRG
jgi:acyl-CoA thioester hydrolase